MRFYCGIDLGARKTHLCLFNEDNKRPFDRKVENDFNWGLLVSPRLNEGGRQGTDKFLGLIIFIMIISARGSQ